MPSDQIGAESGPGGQSGGTGQPAGMPAHDLDDGHHASVIDVGVMPDLHTGGGDILGGAGKAGAVVCAVEVVVDGLGDAHDAALVAHLLHILGDLVAGIHGVVAAVIEEITHIIFLEDLQNALIVRIVLVRVGKLIPAGAQCRGGGVLEKLQLLGGFLAHIIQLVLQHALDPVGGAQYAGDTISFQRRLDGALGAGIDDGSGAAGLTDDTCSSKFAHDWSSIHNFLTFV